jgi:hypothetical protein
MRGGVILIALALVIAYLGVTGRYKCFGIFFNCAIDPTLCSCGGSGAGEGQATSPGAPIEVAPGSSGVNPSGGQVYDATTRLLPIEAFV